MEKRQRNIDGTYTARASSRLEQEGVMDVTGERMTFMEFPSDEGATLVLRCGDRTLRTSWRELFTTLCDAIEGR